MELQQFICENNNNYESIFKENGFILRYDRKKNLLLVKNHYDKPLTFTDDFINFEQLLIILILKNF